MGKSVQLASRVLAVPFVLLSLGAAIPARAAHQVVSVAEERVGPLLVSEEVVQAGADPLDRFTVHRVRKPAAPVRGVLLLMPGGGSNFDLYTADEEGNLLDSFAGYFAVRGFDVWGYSPRTRGIAPGACAGAVDCSAMRGWGMATVVADALYIRERIRAVHGGARPVIGGFSLGAMSALAVIDASPQHWAGALVWEGMIYSEDPAVLAGNSLVCADLEARLAAGEIWDDSNYSTLALLAGLAFGDPDGPSPLPGFEGLTNHQVFVLLLTTPQPVPPGYVPGYTLMAGSLAEGFRFASEARIAMLIAQFNAYEPLALIRDYTCALGGERTFTGNPGGFTAPVYAVGAGHGFGPWMDDNLALLGTDDITWNFVPDFAHGDHFASPEHRRLLEGPIFAWLKRIAER